MADPILHLGAVITCPHAGQAAPVTTNTRVLVNGLAALLATDNFPITGCLCEVATPSGIKPQPCTGILWTAPATRVLVNGQPVLVVTSTGECLSAEQIPQGPPMPIGVQPRVIAL